MDTEVGNIFKHKPLICIPIAAASPEDLRQHVEYVRNISPDIIEFRADYYQGADCIEALKYISAQLPNIPIIFTFRKYDEGGVKDIEEGERARIILKAITAGYIGLIDIEESTSDEYLNAIVGASKKEGIPVIMSYHNLNTMPPYDFIENRINRMQQKGADIAKIAVTPRSRSEAFEFADEFRKIKEKTNMPTIIVTMGENGMFLRLFGWVLDSPIIYAAGLVHTAPGQPPAQFIKWLNKR